MPTAPLFGLPCKMARGIPVGPVAPPPVTSELGTREAFALFGTPLLSWFGGPTRACRPAWFCLRTPFLKASSREASLASAVFVAFAAFCRDCFAFACFALWHRPFSVMCLSGTWLGGEVGLCFDACDGHTSVTAIHHDSCHDVSPSLPYHRHACAFPPAWLVPELCPPGQASYVVSHRVRCSSDRAVCTECPVTV
jgi:hypothetical protein